MNIRRSTNLLLTVLLSTVTLTLSAQDTIRVKNAEAILYTGVNANAPLIVGIGGSEGGNAWARNFWKEKRDGFIARGYAFLAIAYFGTKNTPPILDRIAIDEVYDLITVAKKHKKVDPGKVALMGGSRGADLALLLASYYPDFSAVVAMSSSHAVFPGHTQEFTTSCWTFRGKELPFIPVNEAAVPFLMKGDLRGVFTAMLQDTVAEQRALIRVEKINGAVLLMSGKKDEMIPATSMADKMVNRFKQHDFKHYYQHIAYEGGHTEPTEHFDVIYDFLEKHFLKK